MSEIWADEIVSARSSGGFSKFSPGRLLISKGRVVECGGLSKARLRNKSKRIIRQKLVTPGFVDSHTHLLFAGNRSDEWNLRLQGATYQEIAARGGGIQKTVGATRLASEAELVCLGVKRCREFLKFGVTTLEAKSGYGLDLETELKILRSLAKLRKQSPLQIFPTFMGAHAKPKEFSSTRAYVEHLKTWLPQIEGLAFFQDVFCERGYFSETETVGLLKEGLRYGLRPKVHAHEFGRTGGVSAAVRVKAVSADHLMFVSDEDIRLLKKASVVPVILPGTSLFLGGKQFAPARRIWDAGLKVAIASDFNPGTNPTQNFPLVGTLAAIFQGLSLEEVLTAQTWHGALALGLRDRGCFEPGMRADFVGWDHEKFEEIYYSYGSSRVILTYLGGQKIS